jgi:Predicted esterase
MPHHEVNFNFKARYFKSGEINEYTQHIWFVLHGYGQLAEYFIRKFRILEDSETCIIAPEGLARFYKEENAGRVGATWMTKENRLMDIENYVSYLNSVYNKEVLANLQSKVTVLGFSQGAATASRWVLDNSIRFDRLILWAGIFPPDIDFQKGQQVLAEKEVIEVYGKSDPYLTDERFKEMTQLNEKLKLNIRLIEFEGGHDLDANTLKLLAD